jgi:hypothetical protein
MTSEPTVQPVSCLCEAPVAGGVVPCPMCGGGLVPLRGQWRCSRCYFSLCAGCEPSLGYETNDAGD